MSAAARLLAGLERRGVEVSAIGGALHYTCTKAALGPADVADLRHHKAELIALLARRECPAARLDRLWTEALARAGEGFARAGAAPPERALLAAARIELDLLEDLVPRGLERGDAEALLEAIYAQQLHAELLESGRVRVQASTPFWERMTFVLDELLGEDDKQKLTSVRPMARTEESAPAASAARFWERMTFVLDELLGEDDLRARRASGRG